MVITMSKRRGVTSLLLLVFVTCSVYSQRDPIVKANWTLAAYTNAYSLFIDKSMVKETKDGTFVAFQLRIARTDTKEGQRAKQADYLSITKLIGATKAKQFSHEVSLIEIDCREEQSRDLRVWLNDKESQTIYDFPEKQISKKWIHHAEGSFGSRAVKMVCDAAKS